MEMLTKQETRARLSSILQKCGYFEQEIASRLPDDSPFRLGDCDFRLANVDLRSADLEGVDFSGAYFDLGALGGANLQGARLVDAHFGRAAGILMAGVNLTGSTLRGAFFFKAYLPDANFNGADMKLVRLEEADLRNANMRNTDLRGATLDGADLKGADLCRVKVSAAGLVSVKNLEYAILDSGKLTDAVVAGYVLMKDRGWRYKFDRWARSVREYFRKYWQDFWS